MSLLHHQSRSNFERHVLLRDRETIRFITTVIIISSRPAANAQDSFNHLTASRPPSLASKLLHTIQPIEKSATRPQFTITLPAAFNEFRSRVLILQHTGEETRYGNCFALEDASSHWSHETAANGYESGAVFPGFADEVDLILRRVDFCNRVRPHCSDASVSKVIIRFGRELTEYDIKGRASFERILFKSVRRSLTCSGQQCFYLRLASK